MTIITTVKGDLIKNFKQGVGLNSSEAGFEPNLIGLRMTAMAHGCNCFNTMGAGIAAQVMKELPLAYQADMNTVKGEKSKLGRMTSVVINLDDGNKGTVYNLYTQFKCWGSGPNVDLVAVRNCFDLLNKQIGGGTELLGIPKIGAGLAGGDWDEIYDIINSATPDLDIVLFEYEAPAKAGEEVRVVSIKTTLASMSMDSVAQAIGLSIEAEEGPGLTTTMAYLVSGNTVKLSGFVGDSTLEPAMAEINAKTRLLSRPDLTVEFDVRDVLTDAIDNLFMAPMLLDVFNEGKMGVEKSKESREEFAKGFNTAFRKSIKGYNISNRLLDQIVTDELINQGLMATLFNEMQHPKN